MWGSAGSCLLLQMILNLYSAKYVVILMDGRFVDDGRHYQDHTFP